MGKYIRKSKIDGEALALMDVSPSSLGVLTRAKSLALQRRLQKPSSSSSLPTSPSPNPPSKQKQKQKTTDCGGSYLQLRSRRLQKKPPIVLIRSTKRRKQQRRKETCGRNPNPNPQKLDSLVGSIRGSRSDSVAESAVCGKEKGLICEINKDPCIETSFGENFLELEGSERTTRESTPCSLIRKPETITTPGSSTKLNNGISDNSDQREESLSGSHRHLPTTPEMDEFFSGAEEEQQKQFIEKYNFDPVNEQPLPGRFEWKKVDD
ncbi:hypothetical protein EUTSA_v10017093mg [Eutrema salsugineum]|uniref:Cyclin-dependent kinase inhibitor domain-containing protein n=1 Tax=Eutrema salsugineum TaxID=72664 RepID=V4M9R1_EUTSA|nr:cyclin-dependent kinase inhibitor 4 [Eutrema salsugineum]ESQ51852.1 hypothetical protein EUTSA_v10017093mg [Eutrema salsugineum]